MRLREVDCNIQAKEVRRGVGNYLARRLALRCFYDAKEDDLRLKGHNEFPDCD